MLTIRAMSNGAGYAERHLQYSDYLDEQNQVKGLWQGKAAERLGLVGEVTVEQFERLRESEHPETGEFLRQRKSADRTRADGSKQSNGIHFYDFTFSAPKSVSIMGVLEDPRLIDAHQKAVTAALSEVEVHASAEDQRKRQKIVRQTGNLAIATYQHDTSRQLDPQVHSHCVVFNVTHDEKTGKWKALDARGLYERRAYLTEVYRNVLAHEVRTLGYEIENRWNSKGTDQSFEIKQVSRELCKEFSKRSAEKESAIADFIAKEGREPSNNEVSVLVRNSREDKLREIATEEVREHQRSQLTPRDAKQLEKAREGAATNHAVPVLSHAAPSLDHAKEHLFERISVAHDYEVLTEALHHGRGQIELGDLKGQLDAQQRTGALIGAHGQVATKESLAREQGMIAAINRDNGCLPALMCESSTFEPSSHLSAEQKRAVGFILKSRDLAVCLQGAAGTGKSDTLREIEHGLVESGQMVAAVAPTQTAVRELKDRGFHQAMTVERLLQDSEAQQSLVGKVLVVDEAAMVSGRQMAGLIGLTQKAKGRLILVGDTQQIRSVEASDALRILQKESKLKTATLREVRRQIEPEYREASKTLWKDREKGFEMLEAMGAVQSVEFLDRPQATVNAFMEAKKQPNRNGQERTVLVVCPTHDEIDRYSTAIRKQLKEQGKLRDEQKLDRLEALNWTSAQRKDIQRYDSGQVLVFHRGIKNARRHEQLTVMRLEKSKIIATNCNGKEISLTGKQAGAFGVFIREKIDVAAGDQLLLQANHKQRGLEITNGDLVLVRSLDAKGRIHLEDGRTLPTNYRQFKHGYAMTAHRSQGKSADAVVVSADRMDGDLFYVAASRGRELVRVLTSNLSLLRQSVTWDSKRQSATELFEQNKPKEKQQQQQAAWAQKVARAWQQAAFIKSRNARTKTSTPAFHDAKARSFVSER
jgi:conjugative relaxase-like TrwC/TraI family protein